MNKKSTRMGYLMLLPSVLLILVLILYPTVNTIYQSFFEIRTQTAALGPKFVGFRNYVKAFQDEHFWDTLWWTLAFTAVSVALELIIGMGLALLMNRKIPGQGLIRTAVLIPWGIPTVVSGIIWTQFFAQNGIVNSTLAAFNLIKEPLSWLGNEWLAKLSILIADVWKNTPYMSLLLLSGLLTISRDYYEAASIDGASGFVKLKSIIMPLMMSSVTICLFLTLSRAFMVYDVNLSLTAGAPYGTTEMAAMHVYEKAFTSRQFGTGQAEALVLFIITACISGLQVYLTKKKEVAA